MRFGLAVGALDCSTSPAAVIADTAFLPLAKGAPPRRVLASAAGATGPLAP